MFNRILKLFKNTKNIKLGRWEHRISDKKKKIKSIWSNSDHCGDYVCGNPEIVKHLIEKDKTK
tara:strand:+ start:318 stop:506 length:189 start_codon:yes stop_codon:yes gene_type:complete